MTTVKGCKIYATFYENKNDEVAAFRNEWQNKQDVATRVSQLDLQNKLDTIKRIADYDEDGFSTYRSKIK